MAVITATQATQPNPAATNTTNPPNWQVLQQDYNTLSQLEQELTEAIQHKNKNDLNMVFALIGRVTEDMQNNAGNDSKLKSLLSGISSYLNSIGTAAQSGDWQEAYTLCTDNFLSYLENSIQPAVQPPGASLNEKNAANAYFQTGNLTSPPNKQNLEQEFSDLFNDLLLLPSIISKQDTQALNFYINDMNTLLSEMETDAGDYSTLVNSLQNAGQMVKQLSQAVAAGNWAGAAQIEQTLNSYVLGPILSELHGMGD